MRYLKVYGFLKEPMDKIVLVVCSNYDYFHGKGHFFLRYIIFGKGNILDEPSEDTVKSVFKAYPDIPIVTVHGPCISCFKRGVIGPSGHGMPADYSEPDENEPEDEDDTDTA